MAINTYFPLSMCVAYLNQIIFIAIFYKFNVDGLTSCERFVCVDWEVRVALCISKLAHMSF